MFALLPATAMTSVFVFYFENFSLSHPLMMCYELQDYDIVIRERALEAMQLVVLVYTMSYMSRYLNIPTKDENMMRT